MTEILKKEIKKEFRKQRKNKFVIIKKEAYSICCKNPKKKEKLMIKVFYNNIKAIVKFEESYTNRKLLVNMIVDLVDGMKTVNSQDELLKLLYSMLKEYTCELDLKDDSFLSVKYNNWDLKEIKSAQEGKEIRVRIKNSIKEWSFENEDVITGMTEKRTLIFQPKTHKFFDTSIMLMASKEVEDLIKIYTL